MTTQTEFFQPGATRFAVKSVPYVRGSLTSQLAAQSVEDAEDQEAIVLNILKATDGATDEEIYQRYVELCGITRNRPAKDSSIRRARVSLVKAGKVIERPDDDCPIQAAKRLTTCGRMAVVWVAR